MTLTTSHLMCENMKDYLLGKCKYHETNVKIYFQNPVGIGEHPDVIDAIHSQIQKISEAEDNINTLKKHFNDHNSIQIDEN